MDKNTKGLVLLLLQEGSRSHAIKLYQEEMGVSSSQARESVAALAREHGLPSAFASSAAGMLILLALIAGLLLAF